MINFKPEFFGSTTVGERGQVVIPAEARAKFGIEAGDKLLVLGPPRGGALVLVKAEKFKHQFGMMIEKMRQFHDAVDQERPAE